MASREQSHYAGEQQISPILSQRRTLLSNRSVHQDSLSFRDFIHDLEDLPISYVFIKQVKFKSSFNNT